MGQALPELSIKEFRPTRNYLQDVTLSLSSFQRAFLPKNTHDWQYGLEIGMRGPFTQLLKIAGQEERASLDLVTHKVRLAGSKWLLQENSGQAIFKNMRLWLASRSINITLEVPKFTVGSSNYNPLQSDSYATALWWIHDQFMLLKKSLNEGKTSPILLYPHHFDLALTWFPMSDNKQLSIGFSTGDEIINEPYIYLTSYPEPAGLTKLGLPQGAYWQTQGFRAAILPYDTLKASVRPEQLMQEFALPSFIQARKSFD